MTTWRRWVGCCPAAVMLLPLACGPAPAREAGEKRPSTVRQAGVGETPNAAAPVATEESVLGPGFVVWESNRDGAWRIWIRNLRGGPARRLSPDEPGRDHCCAHISPNGAQIAYLSGDGGTREYPPEGMVGALHLLAPDGGGDRVAAPVARSYFENRAVVWRSAGELIHIDGERATVLLDLASGSSRRLAGPPAEQGWLIDATLSWATTGWPGFAPYDAARRTVVPRRRQGGCLPYFSRDGRWGFWTAGAGGPINRIELAGGRIERILEKNDRRVAGGFGYAYFPMFSADGGLFAWAASRGGHDHFQADYEVFVAESDPDTLELVSPPLRVTRDPGTDRFPDVWQPPLALGRHTGEAPLTVRLAAPAAGAWQWNLGGDSGEGGAVERTWTEPGRYEVTARLGEETRRGLVVVRPARSPRVVAATALAGGLELTVGFDEPIDAGDAQLELASGGAIAGWTVGADGRSVVVRLAAPLRSVDRLTLSGVRDREQRPNVMTPTTLEVEPPAWPVSRDGLVFLWETADAANLVADPELGADRSYILAANGGARLDANFAMVADGGGFALEEGEAGRLVAALKATNQMTFEATITRFSEPGVIIASAAEKLFNLAFQQENDALGLVMRTGPRGPAGYRAVSLFDLPRGEPAHVVLTYEPGLLTAYLNGEQRLRSSDLQADFYHWRSLPLIFGDGGWRGGIEGVAIYNRVLEAAEVAEAHRLYLAKRVARPTISRSTVEARLVERSGAPGLEQISPYREALITVRYAIERQLDGPPIEADLRTAQWAILDGLPLAVNHAPGGTRFRLVLEPFADQPQLEPVYLADTLAGGSGELFYVVEAIPLH